MYRNEYNKRHGNRGDRTPREFERTTAGASLDTSGASGAYRGRATFAHSTPTPSEKGRAGELLQQKMFSQMQQVGSIDVKADPYSQFLDGSVPYAYVAGMNKIMDTTYTGVKNIDGNTAVRMLNATNNSQLLNIFDIVHLSTRLNYLYMAYGTADANYAVNEEFAKAVDEALAKGYSTMLTQLPFYSVFASSKTFPQYDKAQKKLVPMPTQSSAYSKMAILLHYQAVQQNLVAPLSKYIECMSMQGTVLQMSFRREAPVLTALYGLLQKKAFQATLNAIGTSIITEYFDRDWYIQTNVLTAVPSRKSNSMTDPLMTLSATTAIPHIAMYNPVSTGTTPTDPFYDSDRDLITNGSFINPDTLTSTTESLTLEMLVYRVVQMLDPYTILHWARSVISGTLPAGNTVPTASAYYERINELITAINTLAAVFTANMTDVRTFLDRMSAAGLVYWQKGSWISVADIKPIEISYNKLLADTVKCYISGSPAMEFNKTTQRWNFNAPFNKYEGYPVYDELSGGAFLTTSLRDLTVPAGTDIRDTILLLPVLFRTAVEKNLSGVYMCDRYGNGKGVNIVDKQSVDTDFALARLDPLLKGLKAKIPCVGVGTSAVMGSAVLACLTNICGYGAISTTDNGTTISHTAVDPDILCFLDLQLEDVSNAMISFARNYAPFRVMTPDPARSIGFGKAQLPNQRG